MIYEYKCKECDNIFQLSHGMNEIIDAKCPSCNASANKRFTTSKPIFKGNGFYITDYD